MPALNGKTKNPKIILEEKKDTVIIKKEPFKKR
jgi:hypothetical protein